MAPYRSTEHEATGYTPNHLVFVRKVCAPVDIVFESPYDEPPEDYNTFVKNIKESSLQLSLRFVVPCSEAPNATRDIMTWV